MTIITADNKKYLSIGTCDILLSLYSTIVIRLSDDLNEFPLALLFLQGKEIAPKQYLETARQFNLIRDALSRLSPDQIVYDYHDIEKRAPWEGNISPVITSCGNFYTTSDGKDLLFEIVSILVYSYYAETNCYFT